MTIRTITHELMIQIMGFEPPADFEDQTAYFKIFSTKIKQEMGEDQYKALWLIAGIAPQVFDEWSKLNANNNSR